MTKRKVKQKINKPLFRKIIAGILAKPEAYDQASWVRVERDGFMLHEVVGRRPNILSPNCQTTACIAGWAAILGNWGKEHKGWTIHDVAQKLLGLTDIQADAMFGIYGEKWPKRFHERLDTASYHRDDKAEAQVAADYLTWFVKNH